jgi:hypothetical protein
MFGDFGTSEGDESPESGPTSAAGTTPAEPTPETATEPSAATEPAGATATPAPSDGTTPAAAQVLPAEDDPFKDTTPATYVALGRSVPVEDIRVFKEGGAVIRPEALPNILSKLAERENLHEQNRAQYDQLKDFERLSEWKTQGEDGKEQTLTGRDALIASRSDFDSLKASFDTFIPILQPAADGSYPLLEALVQVDDKGRIVANPAIVSQLLERANNAEFRAKVNVRERVAQISRPTQTSGRSAETATQLDPVALRAEAPRVIQLVGQQEGVDTKLLTADDQKFLGDQFPRFVRAVTEEERRDPNLRNQTHITDAAFAQLVARQVALRKEMATSVQVTEKATREGQARMAAAARGVKPAKPQTPTAPEKPTPPVEERAASEGELFDTIVRSGSRALRAR